MIPDKIKALFEFIDFLDENKTTYIEKYLPIVNECWKLHRERNRLNPKENFREKLQYNEVQTQIESKFREVQEGVVKPILDELQRLKVWQGDRFFETIYNSNIQAVNDLKETFSIYEVGQIENYKKKYLNFRAETNTSFLSLDLMFDKLDELLKSMFQYFTSEPGYEFAVIEKEVVEVDDWKEAIELIQNIVLISKGKTYEISFDYTPVPEWLHYRGIMNPFGEKPRFKDDKEYLNWLDGLKAFYASIPENLIVPTLQKGIEYAKALQDFHLKHEHKGDYCGVCESWTRRLVLANKLLKEIEPKQDIDNKDAEIGITPTSDNSEIVNCFCRTMPIEIPKEHFKVFVETNSENGRPFLTSEQFKTFIARAFYCKNELPKIRFNQVPKGEKLKIQRVFYEFYNNYCFEYFNTMQCTDKFIKLLTDNFEGWDYVNVKNNFTPKTKKRL